MLKKRSFYGCFEKKKEKKFFIVVLEKKEKKKFLWLFEKKEKKGKKRGKKNSRVFILIDIACVDKP
jgi:hypothetical protein